MPRYQGGLLRAVSHRFHQRQTLMNCICCFDWSLGRLNYRLRGRTVGRQDLLVEGIRKSGDRWGRGLT